MQVEADHLAGRRLHLGADDHVQRQPVLGHVRLGGDAAGDGVVVGDGDRAEAELERAVDEVGHRASRSPASGRCACGSRTGSAARDRARAAAGGAAGSSSRAPRRARPRSPAPSADAAAARRARSGSSASSRPAQAATRAGCPSCAIRPYTSCSTPYEPGLPATATIGMPHAAASRAISGLPLRAAMKMLAPRRAAARAAGVDASGSRTRPASAAGTSERSAALPADRSSAISAVVGASSWNSARSAPASPSVASTAISGGASRWCG